MPLSSASLEFWRDWHREFDQNDGSLPEVRLIGIADDHLQALWVWLRRGSAEPPSGRVWRSDLARDLHSDELAEAGALVAAGAVDFFHVVLKEVVVAGGSLSQVGVFFAPGEVALDYQPGPIWDEAMFLRLLRLLSELRVVAPESSVTTEVGVLDEYRVAFEKAFALFEAHHAF